MFRFVWKRRKIKRRFKKILKLHFYLTLFNYKNFFNKKNLNIYNVVHLQALPQRQHYFTFSNCSSIKSLNFSAGYILKLLGYKMKYFKRSYTSSATIVLFFRHYYLTFFKHIYLYQFKNLNYRQVYYFKKLNNSVKLNIYYLLHKKSYMPRFFPPKRIKRKVLRLLAKQ